MTTEMDTGTDLLLCQVNDGIATLTINNPEKRNALSHEIRQALPPVLDTVAKDDTARVLVVTGAGDKAFVSGADITEFAEQRTSPQAREAFDLSMEKAAASWAAMGKPIVAMIRGFCMGAGLVTALKADIRIAADDAQFGIPAARLGLGYGYDHTVELVSLVGRAHAAEILFSARRYSAVEAQAIGLVNRVVPVGDLRPSVMELAATIRDNAPLTVEAAKAAIAAAAFPDRSDRSRVEELIEACFRSDDYQEGQAAFVEKRVPRFQGR